MICGAARCGVTNKKYLRAADTKFCIRDIINSHKPNWFGNVWIEKLKNLKN